METVQNPNETVSANLLTTQTGTRFPPAVNVVQPTSIVGMAQTVQQLRVSLSEIDELKQSLRYVEI